MYLLTAGFHMFHRLLSFSNQPMLAPYWSIWGPYLFIPCICNINFQTSLYVDDTIWYANDSFAYKDFPKLVLKCVHFTRSQTVECDEVQFSKHRDLVWYQIVPQSAVQLIFNKLDNSIYILLQKQSSVPTLKTAGGKNK